MTQKSVFITGTSRGLGFEFAKQYAKDKWQVYASARDPNSSDLKNLAQSFQNIELIQLDVDDLPTCRNTASTFVDVPIDVFINNAGVNGGEHQSIDTNINPDEIHHTLHVNAIAPLMLIQYFLPSLEKGTEKTIANITSRMGSITESDSGGYYAYRASKAALNAIMKSLQNDLQSDHFKILCLHPGWVQTRMGGSNATITPDVSVSHLRELIQKAHHLPEIFYHYEGYVLPW